MKSLRLFAYSFTLISYSTFAMQRPVPPETAEQQEAQRFAILRDDALRVVIQEGYFDPEALGPQFCHNLAFLNMQQHGAHYTQLGESTRNFAFSPCGNLCAFTSSQGIQVCNTQPCRLLRVLQGHNIGDVKRLAFSPDSKLLYSAAYGHKDKTIRKWDISRGTELEHFTYPDTFNPAGVDSVEIQDFSPDCQSIVFKSSFGPTIVYNFVTESVNGSLWKDTFSFATFSPDGKSVAIGSMYNESYTDLYDTALQTRIKTLKSSLIDRKQAISPSGKLFAGKNGGDPDSLRFWKIVKIWNIENGELIQTIKPNQQGYSFAFSHDDSLIAVRTRRSIDFYKIKTGTCAHSIPTGDLKIHDKEGSRIFIPLEIEFNRQHQLKMVTTDGNLVFCDMIPMNIREALRCLTINQLLILISLVNPFAAGRVIHLTPDSNAWKLVHTMPEPLRDLLAQCLQPAGIVSRLTQAAQQHPALLSSVAAAASMAAYLIFKRK